MHGWIVWSGVAGKTGGGKGKSRRTKVDERERLVERITDDLAVWTCCRAMRSIEWKARMTTSYIGSSSQRNEEGRKAMLGRGY